MTRRLIINIVDDTITDEQAVAYVQRVVAHGKLSGVGTASGPQYAYTTHVSNNTVRVSCSTRKDTDTQTFSVALTAIGRLIEAIDAGRCGREPDAPF